MDNYVEIIINSSDEDIDVPQKGQILLERHYVDSTLLTNGILIRKVEEK